MASMDDIYDLTQKLDESNIEYLLITVQKGKKSGKADVFYNLKDRNSMKILASGLSIFDKEIDKIDKEEGENEN